ncbi:MAG TPA: hypothetical protein VE196_06665 [Pseudonocardiaceae bacterium]|nr:hypothetical protein [Pseudonocardiaceae bacterium]
MLPSGGQPLPRAQACLDAVAEVGASSQIAAGRDVWLLLSLLERAAQDSDAGWRRLLDTPETARKLLASVPQAYVRARRDRTQLHPRGGDGRADEPDAGPALHRLAALLTQYETAPIPSVAVANILAVHRNVATALVPTDPTAPAPAPSGTTCRTGRNGAQYAGTVPPVIKTGWRVYYVPAELSVPRTSLPFMSELPGEWVRWLTKDGTPATVSSMIPQASSMRTSQGPRALAARAPASR